MQLKQIKKYKATVENQFELAKKQLDELSVNGPLLSPLDILRQTFNNVINEMKHQEADLIIDKRNIEKQIGELTNSVDEIGKKLKKSKVKWINFLKKNKKN